MRKQCYLFLSVFLSLFFVACKEKVKSPNTSLFAIQGEAAAEAYDPNRGEGKFDEVTLPETPSPEKVKKGEQVFEMKCAPCHKLTEERLVGPGWLGVSKRRQPQWILNFITNPGPMIDKDPELLAQLELCLIRMPNQGISDEDAMNVLEFMRQNDNTNLKK